jgi:O-antigen/teichoic acid export membrane protein
VLAESVAADGRAAAVIPSARTVRLQLSVDHQERLNAPPATTGAQHRFQAIQVEERFGRGSRRSSHSHALDPRYQGVRQHSLLRNSGFLMGTTISTSALGYAYWVVAAHGYQPSEIGIGSALIGLFTLASFIGALGVSSANVQTLPGLGESRQEWNTFLTASLVVPATVTAAFATLVAVTLPSLSNQFYQLRSIPLLLLFVFGATLTTMCSAIDACFIALRRSGLQFVRNTSFALVKIPVLIAPITLATHPGVIDLLLSWVVALGSSLFIALAILLPRSRPTFRLALKGNFRAFFTLGGVIVGYQLEILGGMLPSYAIPALLVGLSGPAKAAIFYYTWSVGAFFFAISSSVASALFAEGANLSEIGAQVRRAALVCAAALTPSLGITMWLAHLVLELFGGYYASHGVNLLRICLLAAIPDAVTNIWVAVLLVQRRIRAAAAVNCIVAAATLIGAAALYPSLGIDGVGWAWVIAQTFGAVVAIRPLVLIGHRSRGRRRHNAGVLQGAPQR